MTPPEATGSDREKSQKGDSKWMSVGDSVTVKEMGPEIGSKIE